MTWKTDQERQKNNKAAKQRELENQRLLHDLFFKKKPEDIAKKETK